MCAFDVGRLVDHLVLHQLASLDELAMILHVLNLCLLGLLRRVLRLL